MILRKSEPHISLPLVSVIIPTYNSARYIIAAVDSVFAQTFNDYEILVIDDGSTDDTRAVVSSTYGAAVRYIYQENAGVAVARNNGIAKSRGSYIAFLDADDLWLAHKLERQIAALRAQPEVGACHTAHQMVDDDLRPLGIHCYERTVNALEDLLLRGNIIGTPSSVLVEKRWFEMAGGFDPELSHSADWDMWIRIAHHTDFIFLDEPLLQYRWHETNMSRDVSLIERDTLRALRKGFAHPDIPPGLRARAANGLGRQWMVVAGCYFQAQRYGDCARCAVQALRHDPSQLAYLLSFPVRRLRRVRGLQVTT